METILLRESTQNEVRQIFLSNNLSLIAKELDELNSVLNHLNEFIVDKFINGKTADDKGRVVTLNNIIIVKNSSISLLAKGSNLLVSKQDKLRIIDPSSLYSLTRDLIESHITSFYLFFENIPEDLQDLRSKNWLYAGILSRQEFYPRNNQFDNRVIQDKKIIEDLRDKIKTNPHFKALTPKQQKVVLDKGEPFLFHSIKALINSSGFSEYQAKKMYRILSAYSHSTALAIINLDGKSFIYSDNNNVAQVSLATAKQITAKHITGLMTLYGLKMEDLPLIDLKNWEKIIIFNNLSYSIPDNY